MYTCTDVNVNMCADVNVSMSFVQTYATTAVDLLDKYTCVHTQIRTHKYTFIY